ncbi:hypothetical protein [Salinispora arenicola]|uniref:hypothetical protein n=1 Tax=Salinispora arenicola TaxID=168697 RepID=UPI00168E9BB8|nr:hypothetical protein [Salinispora arenicola]NIL64876.1 hypothetical protein [Salinispora arenicola]
MSPRTIWEGGRNINEDTASWILQGGRNINEDTASWIAQAGRNINEDVANSLAHTAEELKRAAERFERILQQMRDASGTLRSSKANAGEWNRTAGSDERADTTWQWPLKCRQRRKARFPPVVRVNGVITGFAAAIALAVLVVVIQINAT